jgi:hypothetical protein
MNHSEKSWNVVAQGVSLCGGGGHPDSQTHTKRITTSAHGNKIPGIVFGQGRSNDWEGRQERTLALFLFNLISLFRIADAACQFHVMSDAK